MLGLNQINRFNSVNKLYNNAEMEKLRVSSIAYYSILKLSRIIANLEN